MKGKKARKFFSKKQVNTEEISKPVEVKKENTLEFLPRIEAKEVKKEEPISDMEIINRGLELVNNIQSPRISGSKSERAVANYLLNITDNNFDNKGSLEPFYVNNFSSKFGLMMIGAILLIALITFTFSPITSLMLYIVSILVFMGRIFAKKDVFAAVKRDISFNVVNEKESRKKAENTLIIASNYSSSQNWLINRWFKVNLKALFIVNIVFAISIFVSLIVLSAGVSSVVLEVFVGLILVVQVLMLVGFYSFDKPNVNKRYGLSGLAVAEIIYDYLNNHSGLIGDNTKLVFVATGGGVDGVNGTKAFIKEHFTNNNDYPNATVIGFDSVNCDTIYTQNPKGKATTIAYERLSNDIIKKQKGLIRGYQTTLFKNIGVDAVVLGKSTDTLVTDFNTIKDNEVLNAKQIENKVYSYLPIITDLLKELK